MRSRLPIPPRRLVLLAAVALLGIAAVILSHSSSQPEADASAAVAMLDPGQPADDLASAASYDPSPDRAFPVQAAPDASAASASTVTVQVAGAVAHPGVVILPAGARVADAVEACGGLTRGTDEHGLNLARLLTDGERIDVGAAPGQPGIAAAGEAPPATASAGPLDLNNATLEQLEELPGVGPVMAGRILAYRQQHGRFASVSQLQDVAGIGPSRLADLSDLVRVGPG